MIINFFLRIIQSDLLRRPVVRVVCVIVMIVKAIRLMCHHSFSFLLGMLHCSEPLHILGGVRGRGRKELGVEREGEGGKREEIV